jgi:hypothetical protein
MSISGNLLDVSIADVMQFVHLGGRTGTLNVECKGKQAEIGFHRGRIINAWTPDVKRLGDLLVEKGVIDAATLTEAVERQEREVPRVSLGKMLVTMGAVDTETLREFMTEKIELTIYELLSWRQGSFEFVIDELRPVDDIAVYPGDILPDIRLNTQMVVLEALRIFDERNRASVGDDSEAMKEVVAEPGMSSVENAAALGAVEGSGSESEEALGEVTREAELVLPGRILDGEVATRSERDPKLVRFQLVGRDKLLLQQIRETVERTNQEVRAVEVELWDAGLTLPRESPPVVLVDLRDGSIGIEDLGRLRRARTYATLLAISRQGVSASDVYEAGVMAVVPPEARSIAACLENVLRNRRGRAAALHEDGDATAGFARLRRVVADLRSGLLSATVALNLMQVISESVERAVMFLVRGDKLVALGAFGFDSEKRSLAQITHGVEVGLQGSSALAAAVEDGQARSLLFEDAELPRELTELIGRPRTGQVVIFPVLGSDAVNSVVYTDNGALSREIAEIEILELAAAQVGVAFENEILRRKMDRLDEPLADWGPIDPVLNPN